MAKCNQLIWVYGRVQGVGFRYITQRQANALGITGYARNLQDGSVEILACGDDRQIAQLMDWLNSGGPASARIDKMVTQPHATVQTIKGFDIRY